MFSPEQEKLIRWYDWFWLLIPIAGIAVMMAVLRDREIANSKKPSA